MKIEIEELRKITNLIFDHIRDDINVSEINLDKDFYWDIDDDKIYDMESKPVEVDVGQLHDDWEFLSKIDNKEEAVSLMFVHLAPLLRYIGTEVGQ